MKTYNKYQQGGSSPSLMQMEQEIIQAFLQELPQEEERDFALKYQEMDPTQREIMLTRIASMFPEFRGMLQNQAPPNMQPQGNMQTNQPNQPSAPSQLQKAQSGTFVEPERIENDVRETMDKVVLDGVLYVNGKAQGKYDEATNSAIPFNQGNYSQNEEQNYVNFNPSNNDENRIASTENPIMRIQEDLSQNYKLRGKNNGVDGILGKSTINALYKEVGNSGVTRDNLMNKYQLNSNQASSIIKQIDNHNSDVAAKKAYNKGKRDAYKNTALIPEEEYRSNFNNSGNKDETRKNKISKKVINNTEESLTDFTKRQWNDYWNGEVNPADRMYGVSDDYYKDKTYANIDGENIKFSAKSLSALASVTGVGAVVRVPQLGKVVSYGGNFITKGGKIIDKGGKVLKNAGKKAKEFYNKTVKNTKEFTKIGESPTTQAGKYNAERLINPRPGRMKTNFSDTRGGMQKILNNISSSRMSITFKNKVRDLVSKGKGVTKRQWEKFTSKEKTEWEKAIKAVSKENDLMLKKSKNDLGSNLFGTSNTPRSFKNGGYKF